MTLEDPPIRISIIYRMNSSWVRKEFNAHVLVRLLDNNAYANSSMFLFKSSHTAGHNRRTAVPRRCGRPAAPAASKWPDLIVEDAKKASMGLFDQSLAPPCCISMHPAMTGGRSFF